MRSTSAENKEMPYDMHIGYMPEFIKNHADRVKHSAKNKKQYSTRSDSIVIRIKGNNDCPACKKIKNLTYLVKALNADYIQNKSENTTRSNDAENGITDRTAH